MRRYQINLAVPDNFDPECLEIGYYEDIDVVSEFFIADEAAEWVKSKIENINPEDGSTLLFRYDDSMEIEALKAIHNTLTEIFPKCKVIGLPKDIDVLIQNPDEAVAMLEKMIAKVKVQSYVPKIIV